jgi:hypothetical protein
MMSSLISQHFPTSISRRNHLHHGSLIGAQDFIDEVGLMPSMEIRDAQMNNARLYGLAHDSSAEFSTCFNHPENHDRYDRYD